MNICDCNEHDVIDYSYIYPCDCFVVVFCSPATLWCGPSSPKHSGTRLPLPEPLWPPLPQILSPLWVFSPSNPQIHLRKQLFNDLILTFFQAFLGHVIFGETHATLWWVGIILTLTGLYVLHGSTSQAPRENVDKKYDWQKKTGSNNSLFNAWSEISQVKAVKKH